MSGAMSEGGGAGVTRCTCGLVGRARAVNLIMVIICVECGAEECGANFHAVNSVNL